MNRRGGKRCRAQRAYRLLVRLYPAAHRRAFGEQMTQMFGDHYRDAVEEHGGSRLRFWLAVLVDAVKSLVTEHVAEARAHHWRLPSIPRRRLRGNRPRRRVPHGIRLRWSRLRRRVPHGSRPRWSHLRRRRNARAWRRGHRPVRTLIRTRRIRLVYRGRIVALIVPAVLAGVLVAAAVAIGRPTVGAIAAGVVAIAWLAYTVRLARPVAAGPHGDGPDSPGGASMREPRRPLPMSPAGSAARPRPDEIGPGQAVATI